MLSEEEKQRYDRQMEGFAKSNKTHGIMMFRRPNPLSFVFQGGDADAASTLRIDLASGIVPMGSNDYGVNLTFPKFQTIDWVFILKTLFSLFAILITFDTISGEKERGTLSLMCSNSVSKASIVIGKYLGALITVAVPAAAGILISLETNIEPTMGMNAILKGIVASIIGGIGNIPGAMFGGLFLGIAENLGIWKISAGWKDCIAFVILIVFLLFRPGGIMGVRPEGEQL